MPATGQGKNWPPPAMREGSATSIASAGASAANVALEIRAVHKSYGADAAVDDVSLSIARGELLTLLGPSGSGKTTLLMMIAGFVDPDRGELLLDGRPLAEMPPHKRNIGIVFQQYSLFPHMSVADNVAY